MPTEYQPHKKNKEQIATWIRRYQEDAGDEEAQALLIRQYEDLVHSLARKFSKGRDMHEDLVQVGMIGLMAAFDRFDFSYGRSFESFAVPTIIGEIKRYIRDKTWSVHVPRRIKELGPRIRKAVDGLTHKNGRSPQVEEIAAYLNTSEEEVLEAMEVGKSYQALSVDSTIEADQEGSTVTLLDLVPDSEDGYKQKDQQLLLEKAFEVLTEREQQILQCTYFESLSQKETGKRLDISQMHVSRLQRRALQKLRKAIPQQTSGALK